MKRILIKSEPYFFYFIILLHCLPVLVLNFFVTHDGPAHVYNSYLINSLLFHNDILTADFFSLRSFPEPNWIGHALMMMMSYFLSPVASEHVLLLLYLIFFPVAFRKLILLSNPDSSLLSYLIFPFLYSYAFYGGLYNFMLGIPILLFAILFLLKKRQHLHPIYFLSLFIIGLVLYFSHLLIFGIFVLLVPFLLLLRNGGSAPDLSENETASKGKLARPIFLSLLMLLPGLVLSIKFLFEKITSNPVSSPTFSKNISFDLITILPIIALNDRKELKYGIIFGIILMGLITAVLFAFWKNRNKITENKIRSFNFSLFWLTSSVLMLICYFVLPDSFATGGVVKVRFSYFFFLFLFLWLATQNIPARILYLSIAALVLLTFARLYYFVNSSIKLNKDAAFFYSALEFIDPNSIVLPLNYSSNWMHSNLSNYLGTDKHLIILDNYEAGREHFPLTWNKDMNPVASLGNFNGSVPLCADVSTFQKVTSKKIDYVILWKYEKELNDSCSLKIQSMLGKNFRLVFKTPGRQLLMYKRR